MTIITREQALEAIRIAYFLIRAVPDPTPDDQELASRLLFCINKLEAVTAGGW